MNREELPGASTALTMGIIGLVTSIVCCGPFAAIFCIIGLSKAKAARLLYEKNPEMYTGFENVKDFFLYMINIWPFIIILFLLFFYLRKRRLRTK